MRTLAALVLAALPLLAAEPLKVYLIGNSLTDELKYDDWIEFVTAAGHPAVYGRKMIPGAPISWHMSHPKDGFATKFGYPDEAFASHPWDVLTLQPFTGAEREIPAAIHYAKLMWASRPDARVYLYAQWPNRSNPDWQDAWINEKRPSYDAVFTGLREAVPEKADRTFMIPVGHAFHRLEKKIQLGLVPGLSSIWDLYSDNVHVSNIGSYLVALGFYATLFETSPMGLPIGNYGPVPGSSEDAFEIDAELARILQETTWEAVTGHPHSGVVSGEPPVVTLRGLLPATVGEPYAIELDAAHGRPPYRWSVAQDSPLPEGFSLSETGVLTGTAASEATLKIPIALTDSAGASATRTFELKVEPDRSPAIPDQKLPPLAHGKFVDLSLKSTGGNGTPSWAIVDGRLPAGLALEPSGRLTGSPAATGDFAFTARVEDGDAGSPESATLAFSGTVSPADGATVILVRRAGKVPKIDGKVTPADGWSFPHEAGKALRGGSDNRVAFDAVWTENQLHLAVRVTDASIVEGKPASAHDAVVLYLDALNNREATYNFDDRRVVATPQGQRDRDGSVYTGFDPLKGSVTDDGYVVEASFKLSNLGLRGFPAADGKKKSTTYAGTVIGFDVVNHDRDETTPPDEAPALRGWAGTAENWDDASGFGTLILQP